MDIMDTIRARHSVRDYLEKPLDGETLAQLTQEIETVANQSGLSIQLVLDNPEVFQKVARFGLIRGATASIVFAANGKTEDERIGYWGQRIVLRAQEMGLNTCWAMMFAPRKSRAQVPEGKKLRVVIAVGYGRTPGKPRRSKLASDVASVTCAEEPSWFPVAVEAALLAPTGMNRQDFHIELAADGRTVRLSASGKGLTMLDLGIVRRNFEEAARSQGADFQFATSL